MCNYCLKNSYISATIRQAWQTKNKQNPAGPAFCKLNHHPDKSGYEIYAPKKQRPSDAHLI
jgi:hypothetical protein